MNHADKGITCLRNWFNGGMNPWAKQADGIFARFQLKLQTIIYVLSVVKCEHF